jgi:hypothetical protein
MKKRVIYHSTQNLMSCKMVCFLSPTDFLGLLSLSWIEDSQIRKRRWLSQNGRRVTPSNREWSIIYRKEVFVLDDSALMMFKETDKYKNPEDWLKLKTCNTFRSQREWESKSVWTKVVEGISEHANKKFHNWLLLENMKKDWKHNFLILIFITSQFQFNSNRAQTSY